MAFLLHYFTVSSVNWSINSFMLIGSDNLSSCNWFWIYSVIFSFFSTGSQYYPLHKKCLFSNFDACQTTSMRPFFLDTPQNIIHLFQVVFLPREGYALYSMSFNNFYVLHLTKLFDYCYYILFYYCIYFFINTIWYLPIRLVCAKLILSFIRLPP